MTSKERLHQIIDQMDSARADAWLAVMEPGDGAVDGHHEQMDPMALHDPEWQELILKAQATPPDERTPFQDGLVLRAARESELVKTPEGRAQLERDRRDRERILANARPLDESHPVWGMVGMFKREPGEPKTNVAENVDEYLAGAYADLHEDDDVR